MNKEIIERLIIEAKEVANRNFCCNHSNFTVGAALLTKDGKIYKGFNVENDGIQSICAERTAFTKALTENNREFIGILIIGKNKEEELFRSITPCGYCRQFISEYVDENFMIYTYDESLNKIYSYTIKELLPERFSSN